MLSKQHIENFLRLNDVSLSAPEDEIRNALLSARWDNRDIDVALMTLQGIEDELEARRHPAAHGLFYTDVPIAPDTLSSLLGIDVVLLQKNIERRRVAHEPKSSMLTVLLGVLASVVLAMVAAILLMFLLQIGPFYTPVEHFAL